MPNFIRVRDIGGPGHQYDAPVGEVELNSHLYEVIDKEPVEYPRPVLWVTVPKPAKPVSPKTSVGEKSEGEG